MMITAPRLIVAALLFAASAACAPRTFRITPQRPIEQLRAEALAATPPVETPPRAAHDLVDLATVDPRIRFDIRYATTNNFMGSRMYERPNPRLQRPAAEALGRVARALAAQGYGILVFDAYRPWYVTKMFWEATPNSLRAFVADPAKGSRHNRGAAVDLTLYELKSGRIVKMPSGYDEFTPRAAANYEGGTAEQRRLRDLLRTAMTAEGFLVYAEEWWHFDFKDWQAWSIGNVP